MILFVLVRLQRAEHQNEETGDTGHDVIAHGVVHQVTSLEPVSGKDEVDSEVQTGKNADQGNDHIHDLRHRLTAVEHPFAEAALHPAPAVAQKDQQDGAGDQHAALKAAAGTGVAVKDHIAAEHAG